jgi:hypothetical protein
MSTRFQLLAVLVVLGGAGLMRAEDKPPAEDKLAPLARFVGEWAVEGKWADGTGLRARNVCEWGLDKKILKTKSFVRNGDKEYQRYEGIFAWHPEKKSLFQISFAYDGSMTQTLVQSKDKDTLLIGWTPFAPETPSRVRQTIVFLDQDHYRWTVEVKQGEEFKQIIEATWKRTAK